MDTLRCKVSVVIPMYNSSNYILDTIKSVLDQDYENIEVVIVDDGSTDNSCYLVELNYKDRVKLIKKENSGVSSARNIGIMASTGYYIAFLDSDDLWLKNKISKQVESIANRNEFGVSYTDRYLINTDNKIICYTRKYFNGFILNKILIKNFICLSSVLVKRECFAECGFFDTELTVSEDYDLWIRIASKYKFLYLNERLVCYRITPGSLTKNVERMIISAHSVFLKNTLDLKIVSKINFSTYLWFYADTFKTTGHYFYDIKNYKVAKNFFCLSILLWPFRLEVLIMLIRSFFKFLA